MAQQIINVGATPNDGDGDPIRTAFQKTNTNFSELYDRAQNSPPASLVGAPGDEPGMYAYNSTYFYYCFGTYDGSTIIWAQVTQVGNISSSQINSGNSNVIISGAGGPVIIGVNGLSNVAVISKTSANIVGNIVSGGYFIGNGSLLSGLPQSYANSNVTAYAESGWSGNMIPSANAVYSLGSYTRQYKDLFLSNSTLYLGNVAITTPSSTQLQVAGNAVVVADNPTTGNIAVTGNINASNVVVSNSVSSNSVSTGAVTATGNINAGNVTATGNIFGSFVLGNGAFLTGISTSGTGPQGPRGPQGPVGATGLVGATGSAGNVLGSNVDGNNFSISNLASIFATDVTANSTLTFASLTVSGGDPLPATDTTISFKIPVTINGNVYYISLTSAQ